MGKLAITGSEPFRETPLTNWPLGTRDETLALQEVLSSSKWCGQPFPGKHAVAFAKKFAETHTAKYAQCVSTGTVAIQAALKASRLPMEVGREQVHDPKLHQGRMPS